MIPKHLHVSDFKFDIFNLFVAVVDKLRITKLLSCVTEVTDFSIQVPNFTVNGIQLGQSIVSSTLIFIEISFLKVLSVDFEIFFKFTNLVVVFLCFSLNKWSNFLMNVFCKLLKVYPIFKEFLRLFDLGVFSKSLD